MTAPRSRVVDGAEAIAEACYRLSDRLWVDPSLPAELYRDVFAAWIASKKRNLWDRVPSLAAGAPEEAPDANAFIADPAALPRVLEALKGGMKGRAAGAVVHVTGERFSLEEPFEFSFLVSGSLQEAVDFATLAHLEALARPQILVHVFDGSRLPKVLEKTGFVADEDLRRLTDRKTRDFDETLLRFADASGRRIEPLSYTGSPEAERVLVAMGSAAGALEEAFQTAPKEAGKTGLLRIRFLSPFDIKAFVQKFPGSVQTVFALEHPVLYLKILNSLHEGMVNRWSWFAALPRLVKFKSADQALSLAGLPPARPPEGVGLVWSGLPGDGSLGLARELACVLGDFAEIQAFLRTDADPAEWHVKLARVPFLSAGPVTDADVRLEPADLPRIPDAPEAQRATLAATAVLKTLIETAEKKGFALKGIDAGRGRWKQALEDYYRPLGPNFVQANVLAAESVWDGKAAVPSDAGPAREEEPTIRSLTLDLPAPTARLLSSFDDKGADRESAHVLPLIREKALQLELLEAYRAQMSRLSLQRARRPFGDKPFGLTAVLEKIRSFRAVLSGPLIARLAAQSLDSWAVLAADLQETGVDALEIVFEGGQDRVAVVRRLKAALTIPVLVSLDPRQADVESAAHDMKTAGADGIVLYQELPQRDFDPSAGTWSETSLPAGPRHRLEVLEALARLRPKTDLPLIAHGGFATEADVAKALALGAQWVQVRP